MTNESLPQNWLELFDQEYQKVKDNPLSKPYPSATRLATVSKDGLPSLRIVLLKSYDKKGFVMYTNMNSKKGRELQENPIASLCFYWPEINKEILVEGKVEMISDTESDNYFYSRPFFSRIGAHSSKQSGPMICGAEIIIRIIFYTIKYAFRKKVSRPDFWQGFRVVPTKIEFVN
jgi:pyridoxamine 5'-phosphate oxidase